MYFFVDFFFFQYKINLLLKKKERDVAYIIHNLKNKKSYGYDYLSNILLKIRAQATLVKPFTFLINQTLTTGIFPRELKISRVKPLFKKGDPMLFSNYRPISIFNI